LRGGGVVEDKKLKEQLSAETLVCMRLSRNLHNNNLKAKQQ
jgi:hypothetical protein